MSYKNPLIKWEDFYCSVSLLEDKWCYRSENPRDKCKDDETKECCHNLFLSSLFYISLKARDRNTYTQNNHKKDSKNEANKEYILIYTCYKICKATMCGDTTSISCCLSTTTHESFGASKGTRLARYGTNLRRHSHIFSWVIIICILPKSHKSSTCSENEYQ